MGGVDYRTVRSQVTMSQVLDLLGFVPTESRGDQVRGPCMIHGSQSLRSRSFSAKLRKQAYQCFRCGSAGNQLDLWAAATHQPIYPATIDLCQRLGVPIPQLADDQA
jgi:DNA primase